MADAGNALLNRLESATGVTDLVADRIWRDKLPLDPGYPSISFMLVTGPPNQTHDPGPSKNYRNLFQINCWAESVADASTLRDAVVAATDNTKGLFAGVKMLGMSVTDDRDLSDDEPILYRRVVEVTMHTET